jgi:biuret amidohydrolase
MRRRFGLDIPETLEDACDPATMAVIVYDMQAVGYGLTGVGRGACHVLIMRRAGCRA